MSSASRSNRSGADAALVLVYVPAAGPSGAHGPAVERTAQLEILVNDLGRVRGNRIVRADSLPPGFFGLLERHLSGLRFRPAELGGVPVRVWMPYELRYWAP